MSNTDNRLSKGVPQNLESVLGLGDRIVEGLFAGDHVLVNSDRTKFLIDYNGGTLTLNAGVFDDNSEIIYRNSTDLDVSLISGIGVSVFAENQATPTSPITIPSGYQISLKKDGSSEGWSFNMFGYSASSASGTFTTADAKTVTVVNGIITSIV